MIPLPGALYTYAATALVAFSLGGAGAWKVQSWRMTALEKDRIEAAAEQRRNNERAANAAAAGFETDKDANEQRTRTIIKTVEKIVERPVYRAVCVDADGLRLLNDQIRRADDSGQPGLKMPRPGAVK